LGTKTLAKKNEKATVGALGNGRAAVFGSKDERDIGVCQGEKGNECGGKKLFTWLEYDTGGKEKKSQRSPLKNARREYWNGELLQTAGKGPGPCRHGKWPLSLGSDVPQ